MESEKTKLILKDILSKSKSSKEILPTLSDDQLSELKKALEIASEQLKKGTWIGNPDKGGSIGIGALAMAEADSEIGEQSSSDEDTDVEKKEKIDEDSVHPSNTGLKTKALADAGKCPMCPPHRVENQGRNQRSWKEHRDTQYKPKEVLKTESNGQWKIEEIKKDDKPWPGEKPMTATNKVYKPKTDTKGAITEIDYAMLNPKRKIPQGGTIDYSSGKPVQTIDGKVMKAESANPDPSTGVDLAAAAARLSARRDPAPSARTRTKSKCNPLIQKGSYMSELLKTSTNGQWELLEKKASNEAYHFEHTGVHPYAGGSGNKYAPHWHSFTVKQGRKHVGIATAHDESDNLDVGHVHALEPGHDHDKISAALQKHLNTHYKKIRALKDQ